MINNFIKNEKVFDEKYTFLPCETFVLAGEPLRSINTVSASLGAAGISFGNSVLSSELAVVSPSSLSLADEVFLKLISLLDSDSFDTCSFLF